MTSSFLSSVLLSISTNVDNFSVGLAFGASRLRLGARGNVVIATLSLLSTWASIAFGNELVQWFNLTHSIVTTSSGVILGILGVVFLCIALRSDANDDETVERLSSYHKDDSLHEHLRYLSFFESFWLGVGLTLTNFGTGVVGGAIRLSATSTALLSFLSSLLTIGGGEWLGARLHSNDSNWPSIVSALLLIAFALNVLLSQ